MAFILLCFLCSEIKAMTSAHKNKRNNINRARSTRNKNEL